MLEALGLYGESVQITNEAENVLTLLGKISPDEFDKSGLEKNIDCLLNTAYGEEEALSKALRDTKSKLSEILLQRFSFPEAED